MLQEFFQRQQLFGCEHPHLVLLSQRRAGQRDPRTPWALQHRLPEDPIEGQVASSLVPGPEAAGLLVGITAPVTKSHVDAILDATDRNIPLMLTSETGRWL